MCEREGSRLRENANLIFFYFCFEFDKIVAMENKIGKQPSSQVYIEKFFFLQSHQIKLSLVIIVTFCESIPITFFQKSGLHLELTRRCSKLNYKETLKQVTCANI